MDWNLIQHVAHLAFDGTWYNEVGYGELLKYAYAQLTARIARTRPKRCPITLIWLELMRFTPKNFALIHGVEDQKQKWLMMILHCISV